MARRLCIGMAGGGVLRRAAPADLSAHRRAKPRGRRVQSDADRDGASAFANGAADATGPDIAGDRHRGDDSGRGSVSIGGGAGGRRRRGRLGETGADPCFPAGAGQPLSLGASGGARVGSFRQMDLPVDHVLVLCQSGRQGDLGQVPLARRVGHLQYRLFSGEFSAAAGAERHRAGDDPDLPRGGGRRPSQAQADALWAERRAAGTFGGHGAGGAVVGLGPL